LIIEGGGVFIDSGNNFSNITIISGKIVQNIAEGKFFKKKKIIKIFKRYIKLFKF
jgi:hypothetical protein